ncbi:acyltransferase family protein [Ruania halotolerans]|uniref:acyltransferase family protein n=1 Tax=Ruania halotolerans TaxID=2897773 RepID=UPI001E328F89|nr:acyltransferase family protein [Ruania halotolerans]UFU05641.1 acyltransferase family protein [Ruania halotolerans]
MATNTTMQGRGRIEGLDGVRALAIVAVLIFHLRPHSLPGGYLGVDVFFVVSGFLITTLLVRELRANRALDLTAFWTRRARRLLPALATVVVASVALAYFAGDDLLVNIGRQVVGALTFSNNWLEISAGSSYFNATSPQLFVNFWSLAVEEQFYLVWPLLFVLIMATTRTGRQRVGVVLGLAAASVLLMAVLYTPGQDATRVYYGTDTHAFGLMIGAALALSAAGESWNLLAQTWYRRARVLLALGALGGLVALMLVLDPTQPLAYRGGILAACLLTALVLGALPGPTNVLHLIFRLRPLAWIGERSYGIYLWHWPVILLVAAFAPATAPDSVAHWVQRGAALVLTLAIAAASYRWIEEPVRRDGFRATARRMIGALTAPGSLTPPRVAFLGTTAALALFAVAVSTAPDRSQVQIAMDEAAGVVEASGAQAGSVAGSAAGAPDTDDAREAGTGDGVTAGDSADGESADGESADGAAEGEDGDEPQANADDGDRAGESSTSSEGLGERISGFGDSMMYVAAPGLNATFPGMAIDAESNRQWPEVAEAVAAALDEGTVRDLVVIAAGTNAGVREPEIVRQTLDLLGPDRQVVLVNIYGSSFWVEDSNETLVEIAADYPNVVIADWHQAALDHPEDLQPDRIHPDMEGMYLYAEVVQAALEHLPAD